MKQPSFTNLAVFVWCDNTDGTVGDLVYITDVQLEPGELATGFERLPFDLQLQRALRYYWRFFPGAGNVSVAVGQAHSHDKPYAVVIRWSPDTGERQVAAGEPANGDETQRLRDPYGLAVDIGLDTTPPPSTSQSTT